MFGAISSAIYKTHICACLQSQTTWKPRKLRQLKTFLLPSPNLQRANVLHASSNHSSSLFGSPLPDSSSPGAHPNRSPAGPWAPSRAGAPAWRPWAVAPWRLGPLGRREGRPLEPERRSWRVGDLGATRITGHLSYAPPLCFGRDIDIPGRV